MINFETKIIKKEKQKFVFYDIDNRNFRIALKSECKKNEHSLKVKYSHRDQKLSQFKLFYNVDSCGYRLQDSEKYQGLHHINDHSNCDLSVTISTMLYGMRFKIRILTEDHQLKINYNSENLSENHFVSYINYINEWWPPEAIAASIGVPTYSHTYGYNKINLAFWTTNQGPVDAALMWSDALTYCSIDNPWGTTTQEIQLAWIALYHQYNVKVLVSAFGSTDFPTTEGADPIATAEALAKFCIDNNLDGVDLDWEDNAALELGAGESWLISCTEKLRELLPEPYIISHAPQAPYFMGPVKYPAGGYLKINEDVGSLIDFYNIQFYNQDSSKYDTYETLFNESDGWALNTAVKQIAVTVAKEKLVVGKGVKPDDYFNTGYVPVDNLADYLKTGNDEGYSAGFMGWQFSSDTTGSWSDTLAASFNNNP